jgi:hypothetical protein
LESRHKSVQEFGRTPRGSGFSANQHSQTIWRRASAFVARKHVHPPRLLASSPILSILEPATGCHPTMDCRPVRLLLMVSAAHLSIDGVRSCRPADCAGRLVALLGDTKH